MIPEFLNNSEILQTQRILALESERFDVATYGFGPLATELIVWQRKVRVAFGVFSSEDEKKVLHYVSRLHHFPAWRWAGEARYVRGSHAKLFISHKGRKKFALVSSANLGTSNNQEAGVLLSGTPAHEAAEFFESLWNRGSPVKPLDLGAVIKGLEAGEFEVEGLPKRSTST